MLLPILKFPDKRLKTIATPIEVVNDEVRTLVANMFETMYENNGVGLAATQVDTHIRLFVADTSDTKNNPLCFINPEIIQKDGEKTAEEGCLSVSNFNADVVRAEHIIVKALNEHGKEFELEATGLLSKCIQHEIDHLNGILFIDYLSKLKQRRLLEKMRNNKLL
jgi:peptide deformylase